LAVFQASTKWLFLSIPEAKETNDLTSEATESRVGLRNFDGLAQ
jgi:hypothetical protein